MNNTYLKIFRTLSLRCALLFTSVLHGTEFPVYYDFGKDPGKCRPENVGFILEVPDQGKIVVPPDSARLVVQHEAFRSIGFLQSYPELNASERRDFVITTKTQIRCVNRSNARRWGIHLFGTSDLDDDGLCAIVVGDSKADTRKLVFRKGLNADENIASTVLLPGGFTEGEEYNFQLVGNYTGLNDLNLTLTVSTGTNLATLSTTIDTSTYKGDMFGCAARVRQGWAVDFYDFSIAAP